MMLSENIAFAGGAYWGGGNRSFSRLRRCLGCLFLYGLGVSTEREKAEEKASNPLHQASRPKDISYSVLFCNENGSA